MLFVFSLLNGENIYYKTNKILFKNTEITNIEFIPHKDLEKNPLIIKENDLESIDINERNNKILKYINYKKMLLLKENKESDDMRLVEYINDKYRGVHITVSLLNQEKLTGEVVKGFDNILLLKVGDILTHIDGEYIVSFF